MFRIAIVITLLAIGAALTLPFSVVTGMRNFPGYLPLHMLFETFALVVSMLIFAAGCHSYHRNLPGNIVLLACAFLGVGLLNFAHMLSYEGMPDFVTPSGAEKAIDFWLAERSLAAVALLAAVIMPWRPLTSAVTRYKLFAAVVSVTAFAYWLILSHQDELPSTFAPGQGLTAIKIGWEYAIIALNFAAALVLWRRMRKPLPFDAAALFGAVCVMALSGFFFTRYVRVADVYNLMGHVYKAIAYLFLYRAIFVETIESPYGRLGASQNQLQATIDAIPDLLFELGLDGRYYDCHTAHLDLLAMPIEDMLGKTVADVLPPDAANVVMSALREAQESGRSHGRTFELPLARDKRWFELSVSRKPVGAGQEPRFIVLSRDITKRKQAEETLRRNEMSLGIARTIGKIGSWSFDARTGRAERSEEICRLFGIAQQPVIDLEASDMEAFNLEVFDPGIFVKAIHPDDLELLLNAWGEAMLGAAYDIEHRIVIGGQTRWIRNCARVERDAEGNILAGMGMMQDITAAKNAQVEIERLSRAYRLLSRVNEAIVRSRDRNELFTAICEAAIESGLFRFAWIGMLDENWVIPVAHAGVEKDYLLSKFDILLDDERTGNGPTGRAIREGAHAVCQDIEHDPGMMPWRDGARMRGFRASAAFPIREAGIVVGAMNVYAAETQFFTADIVSLMLELAADISFSLDAFTERECRERAETELKQLNLDLERRVKERTRQLEIINKELEAFSYSVSHDLRAPLRSIDGFSHILLKNYHDKLDATGRDYLQRVCRASQRMDRLIDDLLQLSQVARGPLRREPVDLSEVAEHVADDLFRANPERQVRLILQPGMPVRADAGLMRIVMDNMLGNAWKYTGKKAEAEIEFGKCTIDGEEVFFVRDNGDGFNMDYVHKLFGTFQRLHGADEFEGSGIGLATVQRIIHRHNGRVWAEGKEGQGATFYFTLPQRVRKT
ncbi:MASE3 domain-containing protein [Candidatus Ferrigenium straubiae]|jgi:PAS domain S-box-containing protein|uniref:MASE3 domain-containing protein n=1 Tax=Candidatus Ferrigenium straubiae TaxID=2919506 RepID=UPI003F4ACA87